VFGRGWDLSLLKDENNQDEWYSNKDLYEMMVALSKGLEATNSELGKTQVLIRDYNGLRTDVGKYREEVQLLRAETCGKEKGSKDTKLDIFNVITVLIAIAAVVVAFVKK
jgi:hypothetical protein